MLVRELVSGLDSCPKRVQQGREQVDREARVSPGLLLKTGLCLRRWQWVKCLRWRTGGDKTRWDAPTWHSRSLSALWHTNTHSVWTRHPKTCFKAAKTFYSSHAALINIHHVRSAPSCQFSVKTCQRIFHNIWSTLRFHVQTRLLPPRVQQNMEAMLQVLPPRDNTSVSDWWHEGHGPEHLTWISSNTSVLVWSLNQSNHYSLIFMADHYCY